MIVPYLKSKVILFMQTTLQYFVSCKEKMCGDVSPLLRSMSRMGTLVCRELVFHVMSFVWKKKGVLVIMLELCGL